MTLLAEHSGRVRGVSRSARRSRVRFGGSLAPMSRVLAIWTERREGELHRIESVDLHRSFASMQSEPLVQAAYALFAEMGMTAVREDQEEQATFRLYGAVLEAMEGGLSPWCAVRYFEFWLLRLHGVFADLGGCSSCGGALAAAGACAAIPGEGLACSACAASRPEAVRLPARERGAGGSALANLDYGLLAAHQGERVSAIELVGDRVTRPHVILREIRTRVGEPLDLAVLRADFQRLENLPIFADIRVVAEDDGVGQVRLQYVFREMTSWLPMLAITYTEQNCFSVGPGISALNLTGRGIKLTGRAYFGGTTQYWANFRWPWMYGTNHNSLGVFFARRERDDELRGFDETSNELTVDAGRWFGDHGRGKVLFSYFRMRSDVPGITLTPDNDDTILRAGLSLGWDTRDSWRNPRDGWQNELEVWRTGGFLGGDGDFWSMTLDLRRFLPTAPRQKLELNPQP